MKKTIIALAILLAANTSTFAQDSTHKSSSHQHKMTTSKKYTCTMHPEVVMNKPGKCPKCGMKLVAMKTKKPSKSMGNMKM
ncbi:MAG: heavy metal-binding domain-containing protein [Segetibacter sp.]